MSPLDSFHTDIGQYKSFEYLRAVASTPGRGERLGEREATAARASAGYDTHQRVVVRSRVTECEWYQRRARCEAWCEERDVTASGEECPDETGSVILSKSTGKNRPMV